FGCASCTARRLLCASFRAVSLALFLFSSPVAGAHLALHSFPTRRSSDLLRGGRSVRARKPRPSTDGRSPRRKPLRSMPEQNVKGDRKSTRLNSSHVSSSYAVFCLKKKNSRENKEGWRGYRSAADGGHGGR